MTPIVKRFLTASLIYLGLGLLVQAVTVFDLWLGFNPLAYTATAAADQILLLGWLSQLGLALAYDRWILRIEKTHSPAVAIHNPKSATLTWVLFNTGLPLVILGQPGLTLLGGAWLGISAAIGGVLLFLAGLIFIREAWLAMKKT